MSAAALLVFAIILITSLLGVPLLMVWVTLKRSVFAETALLYAASVAICSFILAAFSYVVVFLLYSFESVRPEWMRRWGLGS